MTELRITMTVESNIIYYTFNEIIFQQFFEKVNQGMLANELKMENMTILKAKGFISYTIAHEVTQFNCF